MKELGGVGWKEKEKERRENAPGHGCLGSGSRATQVPLSIFSSFLKCTLWGKLAFEGIELPFAKRLLLQKLEPGTQMAEALFKPQLGR